MLFIIILFGLILGSFLNVIILRLDKKPGILTGRSECPKCLSVLKWYDLIPVLSFILLRGKCRYCNKTISPIYPVVELAVALTFFIFIYFNPSISILATGYYLIILYFLIGIFFFDFLYYEIPDKIVFPLIAFVIIYNLLTDRGVLLNASVTGLVMAGLFAILFVASKGQWVGFGDAKLSLLIGLVMPYPMGPVALIISIWVAAFWGMAMIALKRANMKTELPFGTFLTAVSAVFIIFYPFIYGYLANIL
jgi:leader peptidase (prepilin peptidase)/N-methyltransferase